MRNQTFGVTVSTIGAAVVMCAAAGAHEFAMESRRSDVVPQAEGRPPAVGHDVERDIARVRAAIKKFKSLDRAVAADYSRDGGGCIDNPPQGGMGCHHQNGALLDTRLEVERPEMLVYWRCPMAHTG
jgi:hypothetical protein